MNPSKRKQKIIIKSTDVYNNDHIERKISNQWLIDLIWLLAFSQIYRGIVFNGEKPEFPRRKFLPTFSCMWWTLNLWCTANTLCGRLDMTVIVHWWKENGYRRQYWQQQLTRYHVYVSELLSNDNRIVSYFQKVGNFSWILLFIP